MALFRETSYTSTSTYYDLNSVSVSHSGTTLSVTVNIDIQGGSSTSLGASSEKVRYLYMYDGSGSAFSGTYTLKNSSTSWGNSFSDSWTVTFTKNIGYGAWSSNCYLRIGPNSDWNTSPSTNSFWWCGRKNTSTGTVGQTFSVSVGSTYVVPSISNQPDSITKNSGSTATFSVSATGGVPASYSYQWQLSTNSGGSYSNISGATGSSYTTAATTAAMNGYRYRCVVSNDAGSVTSSAAILTVQYEMTLNGSYPQNVSVNNANTASFSISISTAGNPAAYTYQWYENGSAISGATSTSYTTPTLYTLTDDGNEYKCIVTHTATGRTATSRTATVTVLGYAPSISTQPTSQTIDEGGNVTFTVGVTAGNPSATTYQWQISTNGGTSYSNISGATSTSYSLSSVTYASYPNARFRLYASNSIGGVYSNAAVLTVNRYPNAPTIIVPKAGSKTYNTKPYILFQWGTDADGNGVLGSVKIGTTTLDSNNAAWANGGTKTTAATSLVKFTQITAGSKTLEAFGNDGRVNSTTVSRSFTIETPVFTDTITANVTPVKAVHITELRTMLNEIEAYYGLTETVWSVLEVGGNVKSVHVIELRQAAERIRTYINSVATAAFQIPAFAWTDTTLTNKRIKAVHLNEIRSKISLL